MQEITKGRYGLFKKQYDIYKQEAKSEHILSYAGWYSMLSRRDVTFEDMYDHIPRDKKSDFVRYKGMLPKGIPMMKTANFYYHNRKIGRSVETIIEMQKNGTIQHWTQGEKKDIKTLQQRINEKRIELGHPII